MTVWFDMDGTIANLYGVENWLEMLQNKDAMPYEIAKPMLNLSLLARYLNKLNHNGIEIGIISWLAKNSNEEYDIKVSEAKMKWLNEHLKSVEFSEIHIVKYGTPKYEFKEENDILFDDEELNRKLWGKNAFDEKEIMNILKNLL